MAPNRGTEMLMLIMEMKEHLGGKTAICRMDRSKEDRVRWSPTTTPMTLPMSLMAQWLLDGTLVDGGAASSRVVIALQRLRVPVRLLKGLRGDGQGEMWTHRATGMEYVDVRLQVTLTRSIVMGAPRSVTVYGERRRLLFLTRCSLRVMAPSDRTKRGGDISIHRVGFTGVPGIMDGQQCAAVVDNTGSVNVDTGTTAEAPGMMGTTAKGAVRHQTRLRGLVRQQQGLPDVRQGTTGRHLVGEIEDVNGQQPTAMAGIAMIEAVDQEPGCVQSWWFLQPKIVSRLTST